MPRAFLQPMLALFFVHGLFTTPALAQPPEPLRSLVSELVVRVRTVDETSGQSLDEGCGLIVGVDTESLTILTARHVIAATLPTKPGVSTEVLFAGRDVWRKATSTEALDASGTAVDQPPLDAAILTLNRKDAPFSRDPRCADLPVSAAPSPGSPVYAFGLDPADETTVWTKGVFNSLTGGLCTFDADGVKRGFSGGVLVSDVGVVGITIRAGPGGKDHQALALAPVLFAAKAKGAVITLKENPAAAALDRLFNEHLIAAADVWPDPDRSSRGDSYWLALVPSSKEAGIYTVDAITLRGRAQARLSISGNDVIFDLADDLMGARGSGVRLLKGTCTLSPQAKVAIPGLIILSGHAQGSTMYLALPQTSTELVAARALAGSAPNGVAQLSHEDSNSFEANGPIIRQEPAPFCVKLCRDAGLTFRPPLANHRNKPVTIAGMVQLTDKERAHKPKSAAEPAWSALRFHVFDLQESREIRGIAMPLGDQPFSFSFDVPDHLIRLQHSTPTKRQNSDISGMSRVVSGLSITYAN